MTTLPTSPAQPAVSEARFAALKAKLRELFELDKSDLDFGIYRIMAAKNKDVTAFLDRQLKDVVRQTLAEHGAAAIDQVQADLDKAIEQARTLGADPEALPRVRELRDLLTTAAGGASAELEADIYNHLLAFFSRYYDEGDFISQRRYKGDTYAIPYSGEEVTLHWANKDQYYIKSGEWHKDYRFKLPDGRRVRFALVDATQETGNNKEPDEAKRRYILVDDNPVVVEGDTLTLRFHFKAPTEAEKARADDDAVAIFGGKYEKTTKGDERERFCADAEKRAIPHIPGKWAKAVLAESATEAKPKRTLLGKHLDAFTARNTFDYFIHKDLGGFLRRELDFYIKNEVVRLDDLDAAPAEHLQRVQGRVRAIRRVASKVIELLESLENFQKKLWLKKKFVLNTSWLVTVDRVPERLRDTIAENAQQWAEWERLGFKPEGDAGGLFGGAEWGTRAYLDACDKLVVDTRLFDEEFKAELLSCDQILAGSKGIDSSTFSTLVNGDNFHALRVLEKCYLSRVSCLYLDPPYNTDASPIMYKNGYRSSTWVALLADRFGADAPLRKSPSVRCIAIDDFEYPHLQKLMGAFGNQIHHATAVVRSKPQGRPTATGFSTNHEYASFWGDPNSQVGRLPREGSKADRYAYEDDKGIYGWSNFRKSGTDSDRSDRRRSFYPVYVDSNDSIRVPEMTWDPDTEEWTVDEQPTAYEVAVFPVDAFGNEKVWTCSAERLKTELDDVRVNRADDSSVEIQKKYRPNQEGALPGTWWDNSSYSASESGTKVLKELFNSKPFDYPKSVALVIDCLRVSGADADAVVLDYFGGSGTTVHAVTLLNREDHGYRQAVVVEMGRHYDTVLRPRMAKVLYSNAWKEGRAQAHDQGLSALVKCFAVESYDDALNNLPAPTGGMFDGRPAEETDALIRYALDLEMGPHLLDLDIFHDPWGHAINAQLAGDDEIKRHRVDLVETFNYLIGLRVHRYGRIERFSADFEQAPHEDGLGRLRVVRTPGTRGGLRPDPNGPFVFQRVEGEINDANATRVLVVWRKLTDSPERDAAVLEAWMARHRESTTERTEHREYQQIFINGPVTLPQPTQDIRTVLPLEATFKARMFEDTDGVA